MGTFGGPDIITDGLVLSLDAASTRSYPGSGSTWSDLSGNGHDFTIEATGFTYNAGGWFDMADGGMTNGDNITNSTTCTFVFWIRTTDTQSLFWTDDNANSYLGAYREGNKFYNNEFGSPTLFMNTVSRANIFDFIRTGEWIMVEFKSANMSQTNPNKFNTYGSYKFGNGDIAVIQIYNRNLTSAESLQNYNAHKNRFI
tara:strand:+ start:71 stop:667 length:597 start_codon:yes stop_codon:yes gene_type:complete